MLYQQPVFLTLPCTNSSAFDGYLGSAATAGGIRRKTKENGNVGLEGSRRRHVLGCLQPKMTTRICRLLVHRGAYSVQEKERMETEDEKADFDELVVNNMNRTDFRITLDDRPCAAAQSMAASFELFGVLPPIGLSHWQSRLSAASSSGGSVAFFQADQDAGWPDKALQSACDTLLRPAPTGFHRREGVSPLQRGIVKLPRGGRPKPPR